MLEKMMIKSRLQKENAEFDVHLKEEEEVFEHLEQELNWEK
jgi:hypothetical protein